MENKKLYKRGSLVSILPTHDKKIPVQKMSTNVRDGKTWGLSTS